MIAAGISLIATVFIAILAAMISTVGWRMTLGIWCISLTGAALIVAGAFLVAHGVTQ